MRRVGIGLLADRRCHSLQSLFQAIGVVDFNHGLPRGRWQHRPIQRQQEVSAQVSRNVIAEVDLKLLFSFGESI